MSFLGGLLGGLGGIAGSLINSWSSNKVADKNNQLSFDLSKMNYEHQKEFAQNGLKWNVNQAKELGINPLLVIGGSAFTPTPSQVFSPEPFDCTSSLANNMGQDIGRSLTSVMSSEECAMKSLLEDLNLENA